MASGLIIVPNYMPALDSNGRPLPGALMYFYENKTTTPAVVYSDASLETPHTNPLEANSSGVFPLVYASTTDVFTVAVTTSQGRPLAAYDDVTASYTSLLLSTASPLDYGAVGDGVTDDSAALLNAMESGKIVDGRGLTYGVSGTMAPSSFKGLWNAKLKQLAPNGGSVKTLHLLNLSDWDVCKVEIDLGSYQGSGPSCLTDAGIYADGCTNFSITRCKVKNGGKMTGILVINSSDFDVSRNKIQDFDYTTTETDDVIIGIWVVDSYSFSVTKNIVRNLGYNSTNPLYTAHRYTRGYCYGGTYLFTHSENKAYYVDQGHDLSSGKGIYQFSAIGNIACDIGSHGHKYANSAFDATISNNISIRCGLTGHVVSGAAGALSGAGINSQFLTLENCKSIDIGYVDATHDSFWKNGAYNTYGFAIWKNAAVDDTYPRAVLFVNPVVIDRYNKTTVAYQNEVAALQYNTSGYNVGWSNQLVNPKNYGASVFQSGFHYPVFQGYGSTSGSVPNNAWTGIDFDADRYDPASLHNTVSSGSSVYLKDPGYYLVYGKVYFSANATGTRGVRVYFGGAISETEKVVLANASGGTYVDTTSLVYAPDTTVSINIEAFQDSGGSLTYDRAKCQFTVVKVG